LFYCARGPSFYLGECRFEIGILPHRKEKGLKKGRRKLISKRSKLEVRDLLNSVLETFAITQTFSIKHHFERLVRFEKPQIFEIATSCEKS